MNLRKNKKKQGLYRLFAMSQQTAKLPRGSYLCNLGGTGLAYVVALPSAGRRQRTLHLCRLPADGIASNVAATWGNLGWPIWPLCRLLADGKARR